MNTRSRSRLTWLAIFAAVIAATTPAWATITDDINPFGPSVRVTLRNTANHSVDGTVFVTANVASSTGLAVQTASTSYSIPAGDKLDVVVQFSGTVQNVSAVDPVDEK